MLPPGYTSKTVLALEMSGRSERDTEAYQATAPARTQSR